MKFGTQLPLICSLLEFVSKFQISSENETSSFQYPENVLQ